MGNRSTRSVSWLLVLAAAALAGCSDGNTTAPPEEDVDVPPFFGFGYGPPSGPHYNLNIIGVPKNKSADMTDNSGHRIFVPLGARGEPSRTKIMLCEAGVGNECDHLDEESGFQVLDANGTDGEAKFALPDPDPNTVGTSIYSVYVRPLGIPGGHADNQTCGEVEELDDEGNPTGNYIEICSMVQLQLDRTKGKQSFIDATNCMLFLYADLPDDEVDGIVRTSIFGTPLESTWWDWSNEGLKLAQLRFYPAPEGYQVPEVVVDCTAKGNGNL